MSIQDQRRALAQVKADNDRVIAEIKAKLERVIAAEKRIKRFDSSREEALLAAFSNRAELVRSFVTTGGEGYFTARLQNEKAFAAFAAEYIGFVDKLTDAFSGKQPDLAKRDVVIDILETRHGAWHETKNNWKEGIGEMNETKLKSSLLGMIDRTVEDLERFSKKAITLDGENTGVALDLAPSIVKVLKKFKDKLVAGYIADTENNFQYVESVRSTIAEIRENIIGLSARNKVADGLESLNTAIRKFDNCETSGKTYNQKKVIEPFAEGKGGAVTEGKADELASAVFVLTNLNVNQEFFATAGQQMADKIAKAAAYNADEDPVYVSLKTKAGVFADQVRKEKASPKPNPAALKAAYDNFQYVKAQAEKYRATKEKEAQAKLSKSMNAVQQMAVTQKFQEIADLFTAESNVPYRVRAQIMEENGLSDLGALYQEYLTAAYVGDKDKMIGIEALLKSTKEILNPEKVMGEVETQIFDTDRVEMGILDEDTETIGMDMLDINLDDLDGFGTIEEDPITESGETTKINVGEEPVKEAEADNRMSSLMSEFMI